MGCCKSELKAEHGNFSAFVKECIEKNAQKALLNLSKSKEFEAQKEKIVEKLDSEIWQIKDFKLNPLGFALFLGRSTIFQILHQVGCSFKSTEEILNLQGLTMLRLICWKGYSDILYYFLPIRGQDLDDKKILPVSGLVNSSQIGFNSTAIQLAVQFGHLSIVATIYNYFKELPSLPPELDIESRNESGENCALISVRSGNFPMVKLLHQRFNANFTSLNNQGENALKIAIISSRLNPDQDYLQILSFLIETIGLDLSQTYEDLLLLSKNEEILNFLKLKGRSLGLTSKSSDSETIESRLPKKPCPENEEFKRFNFMTMYSRNCEERNDSLESSISVNHSAGSVFGCSLLTPLSE
jgi:hypothetical protein